MKRTFGMFFLILALSCLTLAARPAWAQGTGTSGRALVTIQHPRDEGTTMLVSWNQKSAHQLSAVVQVSGDWRPAGRVHYDGAGGVVWWTPRGARSATRMEPLEVLLAALPDPAQLVNTLRGKPATWKGWTTLPALKAKQGFESTWRAARAGVVVSITPLPEPRSPVWHGRTQADDRNGLKQKNGRPGTVGFW